MSSLQLWTVVCTLVFLMVPIFNIKIILRPKEAKGPNAPTDLVDKLGFRQSDSCTNINAAPEACFGLKKHFGRKRCSGSEGDDRLDRAAQSPKTTRNVKEVMTPKTPMDRLDSDYIYIYKYNKD